MNLHFFAHMTAHDLLFQARFQLQASRLGIQDGVDAGQTVPHVHVGLPSGGKVLDLEDGTMVSVRGVVFKILQVYPMIGS